ncbi:MAG: spore coat associated protein CotJA [Acetatifactor sp.]|nr:spore coat associated protein CotJA [Acetatifactor sp.]
MTDYQDYAGVGAWKNRPLAMAYFEMQRFDKVYDDLEKAYRIGTIFPDLNKPFTGRRCEA